jgi:hypothetical protein
MAALVRMKHTVRGDIPPQTGANVFDDASAALLSGSVLGRLGDTRRAVPYTTAAVARYEAMADPPYEEFGGAYLSHAQAILPLDPAEAARAAGRALDVMQDRPTRTVVQRGWEVARALNPHTSIPDVREFGERLRAAPRLALPAAHTI